MTSFRAATLGVGKYLPLAAPSVRPLRFRRGNPATHRESSQPGRLRQRFLLGFVPLIVEIEVAVKSQLRGFVLVVNGDNGVELCVVCAQRGDEFGDALVTS